MTLTRYTSNESAFHISVTKYEDNNKQKVNTTKTQSGWMGDEILIKRCFTI